MGIRSPKNHEVGCILEKLGINLKILADGISNTNIMAITTFISFESYQKHITKAGRCGCCCCPHLDPG